MPAFRFRGEAALEVRAEQEQAAEAALAQAEAALSAARARWEAARARLTLAGEQSDQAARTGTTAVTLAWHRNWISGLTVEVHARGREAETVIVTTRQARAAWQAARRRRLTLERLKQRALERHRRAEDRAEVKHIDELARARYVTPPMGGERSQE